MVRKNNLEEKMIVKRISMLIITVFLVVIILTACGDNSNLNGTWELIGGDPFIVDDVQYYSTLTISGDSFAMTAYSREGRREGFAPGTFLGFWFNLNSHNYNNQIEFENLIADNGEPMNVWRYTTQGTFSLHDNLIEFVFPEDDVQFWVFSVTDTTMKISLVEREDRGMSFVRR